MAQNFFCDKILNAIQTCNYRKKYKNTNIYITAKFMIVKFIGSQVKIHKKILINITVKFIFHR